jgi:hypothetical protein
MNLYAQTLRASGYFYSTWGWTAMPLTNDPNGFPKRPFVQRWQTLRLPWIDNLYGLPWDRATGLGLILGRASSNLAVIDVDDEELAVEVMAYCQSTRCISTVRKRGHVYLIEEQPTGRSQKFTIPYNGRNVTIELKCDGTQVAAPPTIGYTHISPNDKYPVTVPSIGHLWNQIVRDLKLTEPAWERRSIWKPKVETDNRNNTMYKEAHSLREAGMPYDQAVKLLRIRWEEDYQSGNQGWTEIENTIRSAYKKGVPYTALEGGQDELKLL